jgi:polyhydroxyalkanoate synthesis regulator phasin
MTKKAEEKAKEDTVEEEVNPLYETVRRIVLAAIGAVALAQDEVERFIDKMVERGEIAEKDARKLIKEVTDKRAKGAKGVEKDVEKRFEGLLERLNIPTKSDIDELSEKIATLSSKVESLKN